MTKPTKESKPVAEKIAFKRRMAAGDEAAWGNMLEIINHFGELVDSADGRRSMRVMFSSGYSAGFCDGVGDKKESE